MTKGKKHVSIQDDMLTAGSSEGVSWTALFLDSIWSGCQHFGLLDFDILEASICFRLGYIFDICVDG